MKTLNDITYMNSDTKFQQNIYKSYIKSLIANVEYDKFPEFTVISKKSAPSF